MPMADALGETMPEPIWIRTNEYVEAVKALEMLEHTLCLVEEDAYYWKWAIIVLQNATQAFMVCALKRPAGLGALKPSIADKWIEALEKGNKNRPKRYLDEFLNLYERTKKEFHFAPSAQVEKNIRRMSELRNEFVHFIPKYSATAANDFPQMVHDCLEIIDFLAWDLTRISWHGKGTMEQAREHYSAIIRILEALDDAYSKSRVPLGNR
jgi:hypothetical protein